MSDLDRLMRGLERARAAGDREAVNDLSSRIIDAQMAQRRSSEVEGQGTARRIFSGIGQGAENVGRLAAGLVGLGTDESDQRFKEWSKPLLETGAGQAGAFAGETLATLPLGGAAGAGAKAVGTRLAAKALPRAGAMLAKPMGQMVVEGASTGLLLDPEHGAGGAAIGGALPLALGSAGKAGRALYRGVVQPTRSSRVLANKGVDLTIGQMAPESLLGQMEELAGDIPGARQIIHGRRNAAKGQWQGLVLDEARPPGMPKLNSAAGIDDRLAAAYDGFEPAYAPVKAQTIPASEVNAMPSRLKKTPGIIDERTKEGVKSEIENQLTVLPGYTRPKAAHGHGAKPAGPTLLDQFGNPLPPAPPPPLPDVSVAELQKMRSNLRDLERSALAGVDYDRAKLLGRAEGVITGTIEDNIPPDLAQHLRATDAAYRKHKVVSDAVRRGGDSPQGFTPAQLSAAVRSAEERGGYARGEGGPLRLLARAGRETFESSIPKTGIRALPLASSLPVTVPLGLLAATKGGKKFLTGMTDQQRYAQALELALRRKLGKAGAERALESGALGTATLSNTARDRE